MSTNNPYLLPPGTRLSNDEYRIKNKLSSGGFGITYLAHEIDVLAGSETVVVIKEFFMNGCAREGTTVSAGSTDPDAFEKFKNSFSMVSMDS